MKEKKGKNTKLRTMISLGFGFFIDSAEDLALPMLFPAIRTSLGLAYSQLGLIDNIRIIFQTFSGPFWVWRPINTTASGFSCLAPACGASGRRPAVW